MVNTQYKIIQYITCVCKCREEVEVVLGDEDQGGVVVSGDAVFCQDPLTA